MLFSAYNMITADKEEQHGKRETNGQKEKNKIKTFLSLAAIFIACFLIYAASSDLMMTMKLKDEITSSEEMISSLENQKNDLSKEKENLENPEYVKRFARGKYMVSKPGEQVFKLPAKNDKDDD